MPGSQIVQWERIKTSKAKIRRARLGKGGGGGGKNGRERLRRPVFPQPSRVFRISYYWTTFHHHLGAWNRLQITHPPWQAVYFFCPRKKKKLYLVCNSRWKIPKKCLWRYTKTVLTSSFSQTSNNLCNTWASVNLEYLKTAHLDWIASD